MLICAALWLCWTLDWSVLSSRSDSDSGHRRVSTLRSNHCSFWLRSNSLQDPFRVGPGNRQRRDVRTVLVMSVFVDLFLSSGSQRLRNVGVDKLISMIKDLLARVNVIKKKHSRNWLTTLADMFIILNFLKVWSTRDQSPPHQIDCLLH